MIYRNWKALFPSHLSVHPFEMPGKGIRFKEPPYTNIKNLVEDLGKWFLEHAEFEFSLFGHSLGALIAFELAKYLEKNGISPKLLIVSGCRAPRSVFPDEKDKAHYEQSDEELIKTLRRLNGTPEEILQSTDFLKAILPVIRADFFMFDNYSSTLINPLRCPIQVYGGDMDAEVPLQTLYDWKNYTTHSCKVTMLKGGHFFLHQQESLLVENIIQELSQIP